MATLEEEIKAAERRMSQAYDALMAYVNRPASQPADIKLHRKRGSLGRADDAKSSSRHYSDRGAAPDRPGSWRASLIQETGA